MTFPCVNVNDNEIKKKTHGTKCTCWLSIKEICKEMFYFINR